MISTYRSGGSVKNYLAVRSDAIGFLARALAECGDAARVKIFGIGFVVVNDPDLIREALVEKHETLIIKGGVSSGLARLIGRGILTNRGSEWRDSRRKLQPLFQAEKLESYYASMEDRIGESLDRWRREFRGRSFSFNREILALSIRITCSNLFHYLPTFEEALEFADAIWTLQSDGMRRHVMGIDHLPWLPVPLNRRVVRAVRQICRLADEMVDRGAGQERDEILSILFAGTESPANTLCFGLKLLEDHPALTRRLVEGIRSPDPGGSGGCPAGDRSQGSRERPDLLSQTLAEIMRLYPAGWAFERFASADTSLGGAPIKRGTRLLFSPFLLHRNPRIWEDAEEFRPQRFEESTTAPAGIPKYGFLPFGAGPRSCIGARMAWTEMLLVLKAVLGNCRWAIDPPGGAGPLQPRGSFKIRLDQPLLGRVEFYDEPPGGSQE